MDEADSRIEIEAIRAQVRAEWPSLRDEILSSSRLAPDTQVSPEVGEQAQRMATLVDRAAQSGWKWRGADRPPPRREHTSRTSRKRQQAVAAGGGRTRSEEPRDAREYRLAERKMHELVEAWLKPEPASERRQLAEVAERDGRTRVAAYHLNVALIFDYFDRAIENNFRICIAPDCDEPLSRLTHNDDAGYHSPRCKHRIGTRLRRAPERVATELVTR